MAITVTSTSWVASNATNASAIFPTHVAGDLLLVTVHAKPTSTGTPPTMSTPSGWNLLVTGNDGSGTAQGTDAGQVWTWTFWRFAAAAGTTFSNIAITNGNTNIAQGLLVRTTSSWDGDPIALVVGDTSSGTAWSTTSASMALAENDMLIYSAGASGNASGGSASIFPTATTVVHTQGGNDLGATTSGGTGNTSNGNDMAAGSYYGIVDASATTGAITSTMTLLAAQKGVAVLIRLRETPPPPLSLTNSFEGGTDGTAVSTGNSGGASGDAWDTIAISAGCIMEYDDTYAHTGTLSCKHDTTAGSANFAMYEWNTKIAPSVGTGEQILYGRIYYRSEIDPQAVHNLITLNQFDGTLLGRIALTTAGLFRINRADGTQVAISTTEITTGQWVRLEFKWDLVAGTAEARLYNDANSNTVSESISGSVVTGAKIGQVEMGLRTIGLGPIWTDNVALGVTDWLGPIAGAGENFTQTINSVMGISEPTDVSLGQSPWGLHAAVRIITDINNLSDPTVAITDQQRSVGSDMLLGSDAVGGLQFATSVTDQENLSDTPSQAVVASRSQSDVSNLDDVGSPTTVSSRSVNDIENTSDLATQVVVGNRSVNDSENLSDSVVSSFVFPVTLTSVLNASDIVAPVTTSARSLPDTLALSDVGSPVSATVRSMADTLGLSDAISVQAGAYARALSDVLALTDTVDVVKGFLRDVTDSEALSDALSQQLLAVVDQIITDTLGLSDAAARTSAIAQTLADNLGLSDAIAQQAAASLRTITDTEGLADAIVQAVVYAQVKNDVEGLADAISQASALARSASDTEGLSDALTQATTTARSQSDTLGLTDTITPALSISFSLTDSQPLSDAIAGNLAASRLLADTLAEADAIIQSLSASRSLTDSEALSDVIDADGTLTMTLNDASSLLDQLVVNNTFLQIVNEIVGLSDNVERILLGSGFDTLRWWNGVEFKPIAQISIWTGTEWIPLRMYRWNGASFDEVPQG